MPPKRETPSGIKFSADEALVLRCIAAEWDITVSDLVRKCIAVGLPLLKDVPFARRIQLEDCTAIVKKQ